MRQLAIALSLVVALFAFTTAGAEEKKEVTLKGTITCAKCDLKMTDACATVIKVGDKVYFFDADSGKKHHAKICKTPTKGSVVGTVSEEDDKLIVKVKEVKFEEE